MRLRFATYNMLDLTLSANSVQEADRQRRVVETIRAIDPDVIAVQEVKCAPGRVDRLVAELGERTGLTSVVRQVDGRDVHAVAVGDNTVHVALLWRDGLIPLPASFRAFSPAVHHHGGWRGVGYGSLVRVAFQMGGRPLMFASYHAPAFGRHRRIDQAEVALAAVTGPNAAVLVGSDFNSVGAARVGGESYDRDPYTGQPWWPDLVHQCREVTHPGTSHRADRRPAEVWEAGGLHDVAAAVRAPWVATTGHWPSCPYSVRGIRRRIDMIHATRTVLQAVRGVAVVDNEVSRAASDHLPVVAEVDLRALPMAQGAVAGR
ncbi:endonuclease/exonuclease/phosphatase family protein [Micromonospora sp. SH-82]|uniref:endonuclease/exonuclease/phosphatase family protein n=1 Tax=Micromonospora sp. SH-82 TaxID=3132938 RepID=UPI003EBF5BBD